MKKILMSALVIGSIGSNAYAGCSGRYCVDVNVESLAVLTTGIVYIATDSTETALTCTPTGDKYIVLQGPEKNAMYSTLLTAFTTKQKVSIATIDNGTGTCEAQYVTIK